ncbi:MAG: TraX family protein [Lachnospiraceae bacterium]|nr:TraX family protein [Lachnospiraceae bacterium]
MGTQSVQNNRTLSGSDLKTIGCISMLLDHFAVMMKYTGPTEMILRNLIGRLAFPIFAFLLVEGFLHTKNLKKYCLSLLLLALVSEVFYDLLQSGSNRPVPELSHQNTLFTLSLCLVMLTCIKKAEALLVRKASADSLILFVRLLLILTFSAASELLHLDYGFLGPACISAMYLFRMDRLRAVSLGCLCLNLNFFTMPGAFLALLPLSRYNGTRGPQNKFFFYLFYPMHLLFLVLIRQFLR